MHLIDTDIIIWVLRNKQKYIKLLKNLSEKGTLHISTITIAEVYKNIFPSEYTKTEEILNQFRNFDVTPPVAKLGGLYWQEFNKKIQSLSLADCLIAATANINETILVSLNKKRFPMKDIKLLNF
ncbi:MAG: type II toxin-antitoxin system VapC family toxin [Patescibacteria group bacterium]